MNEIPCRWNVSTHTRACTSLTKLKLIMLVQVCMFASPAFSYHFWLLVLWISKAEWLLSVRDLTGSFRLPVFCLWPVLRSRQLSMPGHSLSQIWRVLTAFVKNPHENFALVTLYIWDSYLFSKPSFLHITLSKCYSLALYFLCSLLS